MLLRLSRASFWLAAAVSALGLVAPHGRETLLTGVSLFACFAAFMFWRAGVRTLRDAPVSSTHAQAATDTAPLDEPALSEARAAIAREAASAASFNAALHAVARVLRSELGARHAAVFEVRSADANHAMVTDLIESQPGFRAVARRLRLDGPMPAQILARAIRTRREAGELPGALVVPVLDGEWVAAAIELTGVDVLVEPQALAGLLALARTHLSERTPDGQRQAALAAPAVTPIRAEVLVVEENGPNPGHTARLLRRLGCRPTTASGMLAALTALSETQFDLVLIEVQPSKADWADALQWFRRRAGEAGSLAGAPPPLIAIGGAGSPEDKQRHQELGFDDHICQPLQPRQMLDLLSKHLRRDAAHEDAGHGAGAGASTLDAAALARLTELDPSGENHLLERVLKAFQGSVARLRAQADAARTSGDRAGLRLVAHTLKSSSASIGALQLSQLCAQIETSIRISQEEGDQGDDLGVQFHRLDSALNDALTAIERLLKERA